MAGGAALSGNTFTFEILQGLDATLLGGNQCLRGKGIILDGENLHWNALRDADARRRRSHEADIDATRPKRGEEGRTCQEFDRRNLDAIGTKYSGIMSRKVA